MKKNPLKSAIVRIFNFLFVIAFFAVFIYMMIFRLKKKTAEFCAMETISEKQ